MNDETVDASESVPTDRERLMALLALTVQELPLNPRNADAIATNQDAADREFRRLDADPAALEAYVRRGMHKLPAASEPTMQWQNARQFLATWFTPPGVRVAAALSVVLVTGLVVFWQVRAPSLLGVVEQGYAQAELVFPSDGLELPWERRAVAQGFTTSVGNDTVMGRVFAHGLLRGRARLQGTALPISSLKIDTANERYAALGEWNVLLWSICIENRSQSPAFWHEQTSLARTLGAAFATESDPLLVTHTATIEKLIVDMARAPDARKSRRLADELMRFREAFAPLHQNAVVP